MQKKKDKDVKAHGLYLPIRQIARKQISNSALTGIAALLGIKRGYDTKKPDDNVMPYTKHLDVVIEVVKEEAGKLIAELEQIRQDLIDNPPVRKPVGKPLGWRKKKDLIVIKSAQT